MNDCVQSVLFTFQDMSEPEGYNDDSENHNTTTNTTEENFNDENDVDDETMSGKHKTACAHTSHIQKQINIALSVSLKQKAKCYCK